MDVLKTKDRAVLSKPKLIVYIGLLEKSFWTWLQPQKLPSKVKKRAKRPKLWPISNKDGALLPKLNLVVYIIRPKVQVQFDVLISSFNFKFQFQDSISNFKFQFKVSISSFNSMFPFQASFSSFYFNVNQIHAQILA